jgi:glycine/serine hydroxymethyltransferase
MENAERRLADLLWWRLGLQKSEADEIANLVVRIAREESRETVEALVKDEAQR